VVVNSRLEADLAVIRKAIADGQEEEAKSKIVGVSANVSPGSTFSKEIGDLYFALGFSAMAGRYWYLLEDKSEQMIAACEEFEHSLGNNPDLMVRVLGWPRTPSPFVKAKLEELHKQAGDFRREHWYVKESKGCLDRVALLGCAFVCFIAFSTVVAFGVFIGIWCKR
jgi:hypothetical protein